MCGADGVGRRRRRHLLSGVIIVHRAIAVAVVVRRTVVVAVFVDVFVFVAALIAGIFAAKRLMALTHARAARVLRPET
mgnify:CR=1 FL=1